MKEHFTIELLGDGMVDIAADQTILEASLAAGIPHYHACGGKGRCSTCRILVHEGASHLSAYSEQEIKLRKKIPMPTNVRLACQTYVRGENVKVHRMIRDETDIRLYISEDSLADTAQTGEEKTLALFFLDIRNFTPFVEKYLPFDVIHIMRRLFALFRHVIESNDGRIIETAGDGFYAVFGFSTGVGAAAQKAVEAGQQILNEIHSFNEIYMYKHFRHRFQVGIGIHTGKVITGNIGIGINNNITVTGLPVNVAARLQAATKELNNSFLISEVVMDKLKEKPDVQPIEISLKGLKNTVTVYPIGQAYS
ncbi:adenylate/guanylate cyclase domain-containing protein [Pontibacter toksunensis]|uniref:Adenylate/guanylate cyclase domain-containing protein n=1 Tax=Pontibacter toksunensis TaxID=1332631 RepID=A0ABW6C360_9BACT